MDTDDLTKEVRPCFCPRHVRSDLVSIDDKRRHGRTRFAASSHCTSVTVTIDDIVVQVESERDNFCLNDIRDCSNPVDQSLFGSPVGCEAAALVDCV